MLKHGLWKKQDGLYLKSIGEFIPKLWKSRHTVVCHEAQEAGMPNHEYDRKKKTGFLHLQYVGSSWLESILLYRCLLSRWPCKPNVKAIAPVISETQAP